MSTVRYLERRLTPRPGTPTLRTGSTAAAPAPARIHRERDFGVGYGSSSGYASDRHYADTRGQAFFRCR